MDRRDNLDDEEVSKRHLKRREKRRLLRHLSSQKEEDLSLLNSSESESGVLFNLATEVSHKKDDKGLVELKFNGYNGGSVDLSDYGIPYPMVYNIAGITYNNQVPILHEHYVPIGHTTSITKNSDSLNGVGVASYPSESRTTVIEALDNGFPFQSSMGLRVQNSKDITFLAKGETRRVNNRDVIGPAYVAEKSKLREMTVTMSGRDDSTNFNLLNQEAISMLLNATPKEGDQTPPTNPLKDITTPPAGTLPNAAPIVPPVVPITLPNAAPVAPIVPVAPNVLSQTFALSRLIAKYPNHESIIENGVNAGHDMVTIENTIKLQQFENGFGSPPKMKQGPKSEQSDSITAHFALSCGISPETIEKHGIPKKIVELADEAPRWGFVESMVNIANANESGSQRRFSGFSDIENMCVNLKRVNRIAVAEQGMDVNNSAYSVVDMPNLMRKVTSMQLEERWKTNPPFALEMCDEVSMKDFRKTETYRPGGGDIWSQLPKSGKIELTHFGKETRYINELDTVAQLAVFDRQDVYNDDMGVISSMLKAMVEGAMVIPDIKLGKKLLVQAAAAATFWVNAENSRTTLALTRPNLSTAYNYIRKYNEDRGKNIVTMINDRWTLITSITGEEAAWDIIKQDRIQNNTTANTITGEKNYWNNKFDLKTFPQMSNTSLYGTSTFVSEGTWILWPSSKMFSPYTITFLRGKKRPTMEIVDLPENMLGYGVRGYWDLEINERERQAILRANG